VAKILIVDDEAPIRALMRATLTMAGHKVVEAAGGEQALEKVKKENIDLVVLDIMMPVTDGYEVLERIKAIPAKASLPVIVVTAKAYESEGIMREMTAGAIDHLTKPFDPEDLEVAVSRALTASDDQIELKRQMMSRGATLYGAVDKMRQLAREADPDEADNRRSFRRR
jgi:two-component system alkaline phosphatase synthesis response regulator PhoP